MAHPNPADWKKYESVLNAGIVGFNHMTELPKLLTEEYSWAKNFIFGFCSEEDLPEWRTLGWEHVEPEHLDMDSFNEAVPLRFGLTAPAGLIKYRENFVMMMARNFREKQMEQRNKAAAELFQAQTEAPDYISPDDPNAAKLRENPIGSDARTVVKAPTSAKPKRRGRPPKTA